MPPSRAAPLPSQEEDGGCGGRGRIGLAEKAEQGAALPAALAEWLARVKVPKELGLAVDNDQQGLL